jgi:Peptidase family M28/Viral BACON domain
MRIRSRHLILVTALLAGGITAGGCDTQTPEAAHDPGEPWIALFPGDAEPSLHAAAVPIWDREEGIVIAGVSGAQLDALRARGIAPTFSAPDGGEAIHVLSYDRFFTPPELPDSTHTPINDHAMLYLLPAGLQMELPRLKFHGLFHGVPRVALEPIAAPTTDVARKTGTAPQAPIGLVQQIVNSTSQASWFQFVRDLSGDSDVTIPGFCTACRIRTRASNFMFPLNNTGTPLGNPFATEYLEAKAASFGFTGPNAARESYTSANSGCTTAQGSRTWQNVVFTLPGQVDFAQSQQVIFLVHYDTISESAAKDANNAPGADDAISGGTALLEAMRLFKDFAWQHPVKFLFVSGEEVGLCGSTAYTRMHPAGPMFRVVNMDQTAFDGNKNGLMNLYNFNTANCPSCVAFGDAFVQANADYGNIIAPAKIVRNTTKMCQTDHCPFWNIGVTAIDLNEDLTNNDICPCFDQSQTSTCRDTVTQFFPLNSTTLMFDQNYSWPTQKAAIALIAHTAVPLYACPAAGATVNAALSGSQVNVTWADVPPVTNYVVERAPGGCGGTFAGIASTATPSFTDATATAGATFGYRVRTCPFQVSNCTAVTIPTTGATIATSPTSMSFTGLAGGANPASQALTISNAGTGTLTWTATSNAPWLTLSATSGTAPSSVTVSASTAGLAAGTLNGTITITAAGATNSPFSVPVTLTVTSSGTNLLQNPGFESGAVSWTQTTGVIRNTAGVARTGTFAALLGGHGTTRTDSLFQQVTIPSTSTLAQLCFFLRITTAETTTTTAFDTLKVQLRNSAGTILTTLATFSNLNATTFASYAQRCFNVGSFAGQTVRPFFLGAEDSSLQTSFVIDDASLQ